MKPHRFFAYLVELAFLSMAGAATAAPNTLKVGLFVLSLCNTDLTGYCGAIERPLDPTGAVPDIVTVGFEYYPRRDKAHARLGVILPQKGGPGYSSTGRRDFYVVLFDPLRSRRDILIVD